MKSNNHHIVFKKLDTTGIIFPSVSGRKNTNVFRITAVLKEKVTPEHLLKALEKAADQMPSFKVKLKRGLFWYYFETNYHPLFIEEENDFPCRTMNKYKNNHYLFRLNYFGNRVNLEVFHVLCDGNGALEFLKNILYYYFIEKYPQEVTKNDIPPHNFYLSSETDEDGYPLFTSHIQNIKSARDEKAFQFHLIRMPVPKLRIIEGDFSVAEVLKFSRSHQTSLTAFFASVLLLSIYHTQYKYHPKNKPIVISIPVDMRNICQSHTVRNFFIAINVGINFYQKDYTFEEIIEEVTKQLKQKTQKDFLLNKAKSNVNIQQNKFLTFLPLPIKKIGLMIAYKIGEKGFTCTLSNMGKTTTAESFSHFIEGFGVTIGSSKSKSIKCSLCSYNDHLKLSFASTAYDREVEAYFFRFLSSLGISVTITTNEV